MQTNWQSYTNKDFYTLDKGFKVKLNSGEVKSISTKVGSSLFDNSHNKIDTDDILFFAPKQDFERFKRLQKHLDTLVAYDFEKIDELDFAITDSLKLEFDSKEEKELRKIFAKLKNYIALAEQKIYQESKNYL